MICNNCGIRGHISRDCHKPIRSYGVILIVNIDTEPKVVYVNRKDSVCYTDLVRGRYDIKNVILVEKLLERITIEEFNKLKCNDFEKIWKDLWLVDEIEYNYEYKNCLQKYKKLLEIIDIYNDCSRVNDTEWEIPKGKQNRNESYFVAATRELEEETNIHKNDYYIIENISPITETFVGEDNVKYQNIYYIGICNTIENLKINIKNKNQITEIKEIGIFTESEALQKIRDYNISKKECINQIYNFINSYSKDLILK